jgi:hypothetical protein
LTLDAPSKLTGTGTALLLDGHDAALVRATIRDAQGRVVNSADSLITFAVESGPGEVAGVHNGDGKSHEPQIATTRHAYHGLARVVVKVTADAASASANDLDLLATEIEVEASTAKAGSVTIGNNPKLTRMHTDLIVTATSPGLVPGRVTIPVSTDAGVDSVLAVAGASTRLELAFN